MNRRSFYRAPEGERRQELIEATLDCISEFGLKGATVRQIALRAGVTAGLVRHYFESKDQMVAEAYRAVIASLTEKAKNVEGDPATRLKDFIAINLTEPVADSRSISLWAAFISQVRVDPVLAEIHRDGYLAFRNALQELLSDFLAAKGRPAGPEGAAATQSRSTASWTGSGSKAASPAISFARANWSASPWPRSKPCSAFGSKNRTRMRE